MNTQSYESIVSKAEIEALKDVIFKRARERAAALNQTVQENYTSTVQNDVMDLARNSFKSNNNPFYKKEIEKKEDIIETESSAKDKIITESKQKAEELKEMIRRRNEAAKTEYFVQAIEENMANASVDYNKKHTFIGALDFLNSQASIALINKKGKQFEAMA